jgi:hypothetical protein
MVTLPDGSSAPAIKGRHKGESAATVLVDVIELATGEKVNGPYILFGDDAECLLLSKDFIVDYDPLAVQFRPDGNWDLGLLAIDENGRAYIGAHATRSGSTFVAVDSGESPNRGPVAVFREWAIFIEGVDDTMQELYRRGGKQ